MVTPSSIGGRVYTPMGPWYHASKHAMEGWSDCLRLELAPFGIRVVIFEPGAIETEFTGIAMAKLRERSDGGPYEDVAERMASASLRTYLEKRASPPELVAELIVKAVEARRPQTRYLIGAFARPLLWARRLLGDRGFDWMIRRFL